MTDQLVPAALALLAVPIRVLTHELTHEMCRTLSSHAASAAAVVAAAKTLPEVIDGMRAWVMGILAAVATLFLVIGGLRYMAAAGDPAQIEQAKGSFKAALTGYALAVLAPVILQALQGILGG